MSFVFDVPVKVLFGAGALGTLHEQRLPGKKALLAISNGKSARESGALDRVCAELEAGGAEYVIFDRIQANPLEPTIMEGVAVARENGCDFAVGLGGGSVLDAVKVIATVAGQPDGRAWDYVAGASGGKRKATAPALPCIAITTSAGTGSEADRWAIITNPDTQEKTGFMTDYPVLSIVDPMLMLTVPPFYTACQGFDALFHCVEGFISNAHNEAGAMVQLEAMRNVGRYLARAVKNGGDVEARSGMAFANTLGGYSMELTCVTSQHAIEHALSGAHQQLPHGAGLIMLSRAYFSKFADGGACDGRFVEMARALGAENAARPQDFIDALVALEDECGVGGLRMSDYGITPAEFPAMAQRARSVLGSAFGRDLMPLSDADVVGILEASYR